jgi:hypothetical protein
MSEAAARVKDAGVFGVCPSCLSNDGYLNVVNAHYFVCHAHKVFWRVGLNVFSDWRDETRELWEANAEKLSAYAEVEPFIVRADGA